MSAPTPPQGQIAHAPVKTFTRPDQEQTASPASQQDEHVCHACQTRNEPGARFCTECGHAFVEGCPHCGTPTNGGDFCEACGQWLLPGKCRFCYAPLPEDARFCEECGCNQLGLLCKHCGTTSFFDFCSSCGQALSERALAAMQSAPEDPKLAAELSALQQAQESLAALAQQSRLDPDTDKASRSSPPPGRLFSDEVRAAMRAEAEQQALRKQRREEAANADAESQALAQQAARAAAQAARREALAQVTRASAVAGVQVQHMQLSARIRAARERVESIAASAKGKTYANGQFARLTLMRERAQLAACGFPPAGWRCTAFGCLHAIPNECSKPEEGGEWVFEQPNT